MAYVTWPRCGCWRRALTRQLRSNPLRALDARRQWELARLDFDGEEINGRLALVIGEPRSALGVQCHADEAPTILGTVIPDEVRSPPAKGQSR